MKNGGPAFPLGSGDIKDQVGMTLRDYFAAHAPRHPWESYEPVFAEPEPIQDGVLLGSLEAWREAWSAWRSRYVEAYDKQWPWYYADAMLAEREREA